MTDRITPMQCRGARAMLDWSMVQLASAAGLSVSTLKRFETGSAQLVSDNAIALLQQTLERRGARFLADDSTGAGVRLNVK